MSLKKYLIIIASMLSLGSAQAVVNGGFETGNLSGWSTNLSGGSANIVSLSAVDNYSPFQGAYFLSITTGAGDIWQTVTQSVSLSAGQSLSGAAAFNWEDSSPWNDGARVRILTIGGTELATVFYEDGSGHAAGYNGPWTSWSWLASTAGVYTIEYGARNTLDNYGDSYGYFDAAAVTGSVPEPFSIALVGAALLGLGLSRKKRA